MMTFRWNCAQHLGFVVFENCLLYRMFVLHSGNIRRYLNKVKFLGKLKNQTLGIGSKGKTSRCAFFTFFRNTLQNFESPVFAAPRVMQRIRSVKLRQETEQSPQRRELPERRRESDPLSEFLGGYILQD